MNKKSIVFYISMFLLCLFLTCLSKSYDYDLFARLIVGERFIENGILPFQDFLSYTPTHPWFDHEWGSGVVFYACIKYFGALGLIILQTLLMFGTAVFVVKTQKLQKYHLPSSILFMGVFIGFFYFCNYTLVRCQMFSFFFFSMFLYILEKNRHKPTKLLWLLPPMVILWNNLHGGVVSGLGLMGMYFVGAIIEKKPFKNLVIALAVSLPLLIINPYGVKYLNFLFSATTMQRKYIMEWWAVWNQMHTTNYIPISLALLFVFCLNIINQLKQNTKDITKTIVLVVTIALGFLHVKLLSLALIASASLCYNEIFKLFLPLKKILLPLEKVLGVAIIILSLWLIPISSPTTPRADNYKFPFFEVEFLKINDIKGNIVVPFGYGSYVSYKLYPQNKIYMDGRYEEVYNNKEFLTLRDYELAEPNWQDIIKNYPTEILMPLKTTNIYRTLKSSTEWEEIFSGISCGIFVRKGLAKEKYLQPVPVKIYYKMTMFSNKGAFND